MNNDFLIERTMVQVKFPLWWDEFTLYLVIFTIVFCAAFMLQEMIRIHREEKKRYKNHWNDDGSPNRPGSWGIQ